MDIITLKSYKIASNINFTKLISYFGLSKQANWKEYLVLEPKYLDQILKYDSTGKKAYIFQFGCISFINFRESEIYKFLEYIESIEGKYHINLYSKYNDSHEILIDDKNNCKLWRTSDELIEYDKFIPHAAAIILAKSVELNKMDQEISELLDTAEQFIVNLRQGRSTMKKAKYAPVVSKILRFQYELIEKIKIFDRSSYRIESIDYINVYEKIHGHYELLERLEVIEKKITQLNLVLTKYSSNSEKSIMLNLSYATMLLISIFVIEKLFVRFMTYF